MISRTGFRYLPQPAKDGILRERLKQLAAKYPRYGYLLLHALLKNEGLVVNRKHTYRIYCEEGLQVRTKMRKKILRLRVIKTVLHHCNECWSMDFISDQLVNGRRFRVLNVMDNYSREVLGQLIAYSITGDQVARFLSDLMEDRGIPKSIICDNGPEFTSKALFLFAQDRGFRLDFIQPGKPTQNAFVESLNGKFREGCLNQHWFRSLEEARYEINSWRAHYNNERPHSSLNYQTPIAFAEQSI